MPGLPETSLGRLGALGALRRGISGHHPGSLFPELIRWDGPSTPSQTGRHRPVARLYPERRVASMPVWPVPPVNKEREVHKVHQHH
jgi:hypothetical protein